MKGKRIADIWLAAFLLDTGNRMIQSPIQNGSKLTFVFEETAKVEEDILAFFNGTARVDPQSFGVRLRNLKSLTKIN